MKKLIACVIMVIAAAYVVGEGYACVGRTIHLGIVTHNERLLAEMTSLMISERTGSSVKIDVYRDSKELYTAVKQGKVNIILENTERASDLLAKAKGAAVVGFDAIKSEYLRTLNMTWLAPIGGTPPYAPVLTTDTLSNYPALPKLLNKLAGVLQNDTYSKLVRPGDSVEHTRKVAKEFLKNRKLI